MGTIFAPTYATKIMGYFGIIFYRICIRMEFCKTLGQFVLDTIDLSRLLKTLNFINLSIKFTMKKSDKELLFLDILIKRNDDKIWIDIYFKPETLTDVSHSR